MGLTTSIVGACCLVVGAGIGGGAVAYHNHRQREKERKQYEDYINSLRDLNLQNANITATMKSDYRW